MKKLLCFLLIALVCVPALAFTNTEYRDMLDNPDFARADKRINTLWDKVQRIAPQSVMKFLNQAVYRAKMQEACDEMPEENPEISNISM